jgi:hypothetical protein
MLACALAPALPRNNRVGGLETPMPMLMLMLMLMVSRECSYLCNLTYVLHIYDTCDPFIWLFGTHMSFHLDLL